MAEQSKGGRLAKGAHLRPKRSDEGPLDPWYIRFSHQGKQHEKKTPFTDASAALAWGAQYYADFVSGKFEVTDRQALYSAKSTSLEQVASDYLHYAEAKSLCSPEWLKKKAWIARTLLLPRFPTLGVVHTESMQRYVDERLHEVARDTAKQEMGVLFDFLRFAEVKPLPQRPTYGRGAGTKKKNRRGPKKKITEQEMAAIIQHLPLCSTRPAKGGKPLLIRPFFEFYWHTGLRPSFIGRMTVPENWDVRDPGAVLVTHNTGKAKKDRRIPLSAEAQAVLKAVTKDGTVVGPIFGHPDARNARLNYIKKAAADAGLPRPNTYKVYDVRHGRITHNLRMTKDLLATSWLADHHDLNTTRKYLHPDEEMAAEALTKVAGTAIVPVTAVVDVQAERQRARREVVRRANARYRQRVKERQRLQGVAHVNPQPSPDHEAYLGGSRGDTRGELQAAE